MGWFDKKDYGKNDKNIGLKTLNDKELYKFRHDECPNCGSNAVNFRAGHNGTNYYECRRCGLKAHEH